MTRLLEIVNISVGNKSTQRLKDINLSIDEGEKIALLGRNGSGKSTLIKIANGSLIPNSGKVIFMGKDLKELKGRQKSLIGTIWQDLRLIEELSVIQNINSGALGRRNLLWSLLNLFTNLEVKECRQIIKGLNLYEDILYRNIKCLSGGQRQRVAIARFLKQKAKLMLADEPISSLDPELSNYVINILLNKEGSFYFDVPNTAIISLHRPDLINKFTRVIGLKNGEILFDDKKEDLDNSKFKLLYL